MGSPLAMLSDEAIAIHVDGFTDDNGDPQTVDALTWSIDDPTVATLVETNGGMDLDVRALPMPVGDPPKSTVVRAHVTEAGVADAITDSFDTMISSLSPPNATRMATTVGVARKQ